MNKFIFFVVFCILMAVSNVTCQTVNSCPPCEDVKGEKRYCVQPLGFLMKMCEKGAKEGGRCTTEVKDDVYMGLPPCKEGLTCNAREGGKCQ
ncbi:unnamed protein product [Larinioides sclopetarius]|uniref:Uncharacterized protein n=2 Tax=Larinioides sclopetarius TaxID=280406 RepID=A0AAV2A3L9_9ARAC